MKIEIPDVGRAMKIAFGKCPNCSQPLVGGHWLKWCPDRKCGWYAPK